MKIFTLSKLVFEPYFQALDMVKVDGSYEMSDERKKLDFEVYPHMVEQLIEKIKEQRGRKPEAKERFDKIIARLKKLAKVSRLPYLQRSS